MFSGKRAQHVTFILVTFFLLRRRVTIIILIRLESVIRDVIDTDHRLQQYKNKCMMTTSQ